MVGNSGVDQFRHREIGTEKSASRRSSHDLPEAHGNAMISGVIFSYSDVFNDPDFGEQTGQAGENADRKKRR
jgi:hypothetical protein